MPSPAEPDFRLSPGAEKLIQTALGSSPAPAESPPGVNHWLLALLERHGPMAETLAAHLEAATALAYVRAQLAEGKTGDPTERAAIVEEAVRNAKARGKERATERDIATVILGLAGYTLNENPVAVLPTRAPNGHEATAPNTGAVTSEWSPKAKRPTPALARFGRDLTQAALEGKLSPTIGREEETARVVETLCRRTKRNPVLVGPAGVGKTAIVEGLARRIVAGNVPALLQHTRIFALQPSTLIAGAGYGDLEKRMEAVVAEAAQDGILLFIDEVHSIVGAGGRAGAGDIASILKPALARGELACIAATTDDEYRRFIEEDAALERRFQPLRILELSAMQTLQVLASLREEFLQSRGVTVDEDALHDIVTFAERYMPNRHFPDKAVDLLEQAVAHAMAGGRAEVGRSDAMLVAQRMVGMPLTGEGWQDLLRERLDREGTLSSADISLLVDRLSVTLNGFDIRPARPNAIVLLTGHAAFNGQPLARGIAETLFGSEDRIVTLDFSRYTEPHHVSMLIGSPPGYVGYSEHLPIHEIAQIPWCVLLCTNIDACHPVVRDVLIQALSAGFLTDAQGKRLYLSDTVTILTDRGGGDPERRMGIRTHGSEHKDIDHAAVERLLGADLVRLCDVIASGSADTAHRRQEALLNELGKRFSPHGMAIQWNDSLYAWLDEHAKEAGADADWERRVDTYLSPLLVAHLEAHKSSEPISALVEYKENRLQITNLPPKGES